MKKRYIVLLVLSGFAAFIGIILAIVFYATSGITETADKFFAAARNGKFDAAHSMTSQALQRQTSASDLQDYLQRYGMDKVTDTSWSNRSIENNKGTLIGTLETETGESIPVEINLISEGEDWKIGLIEVDETGLKTSAVRGQKTSENLLPVKGKLISLARFHTGVWADAIRLGDFEYFSGFWIEGATPSKLKSAYNRDGLTDQDLKDLSGARPRLGTVNMREDGVLELEAFFKTDAKELRMRFKFMPIENDGQKKDWEIIFLDVGRGD